MCWGAIGVVVAGPAVSASCAKAQRKACVDAAKNDISRGIPIRSSFGSLQGIMQSPLNHEVEKSSLYETIDFESLKTKEPKYGDIKYGGIDEL